MAADGKKDCQIGGGRARIVNFNQCQSLMSVKSGSGDDQVVRERYTTSLEICALSRWNSTWEPYLLLGHLRVVWKVRKKQQRCDYS